MEYVIAISITTFLALAVALFLLVGSPVVVPLGIGLLHCLAEVGALAFRSGRAWPAGRPGERIAACGVSHV